VRHLRRPWPLLNNDQDPESLTARVAYHLHRLDFKGAKLARKLQRSNNTAAQLAAGTILLGEQNVIELAAALQLDIDDLRRPLTEDEQREWHFYRVSARHSAFVWRTARSLWEAQKYTTHSAAPIIGLSQSHVARCSSTSNHKPAPLLFPAAARLSTALCLHRSTDAFLPEGNNFPHCEMQPVAR